MSTLTLELEWFLSLILSHALLFHFLLPDVDKGTNKDFALFTTNFLYGS